MQAICDVLDAHDVHRRTLDGHLIAIVGSLGQIRPFHGDLQVSIQQRTSAVAARRLLDSGVLDVSGGGNMRIRRTPRADEAVTLRDLLGISRRRCTP